MAKRSAPKSAKERIVDAATVEFAHLGFHGARLAAIVDGVLLADDAGFGGGDLRVCAAMVITPGFADGDGGLRFCAVPHD